MFHSSLSAAGARTALLGHGFTIDHHLRRLVLLLGPSSQSSLAVGLDLSLFFFLFLLVFTSLVLGLTGEDVVGQNAQDQEQPKQVHGLETGEQAKGDVLTDPTFILLCLPVQVEWSDGTELGENGPKNLQVDVVAQVYPDSDKGSEVRWCNVGIEIVECFGGLF